MALILACAEPNFKEMKEMYWMNPLFAFKLGFCLSFDANGVEAGGGCT